MWANLLRSVDSYSYDDGSADRISDATTSCAGNESINTGLFADRYVDTQSVKWLMNVPLSVLEIDCESVDIVICKDYGLL